MPKPRKPAEVPPARMQPLARLPVFFALQARRAVLAGGGAGAAWKAELLSAAGARVDVFAEQLGETWRDLPAQAPVGEIVINLRRWCAADLAGAALAVGDFSDDGEAASFAAAARAAGVPVNVVDKPAFCDFAFGAIVNRSPLVIGISTDGAAPVFAQAIRAKLEAFIPQGFARWAEAAQRWRQRVQHSGLPFAGRRRFWQLFTARAVAAPDGAPTESDFAQMLDAVSSEGTSVERGSVTLVGAGPGDPELLTLRAVRALQSADVILFDDLVTREILDFARREAKKMMVGKTGHGPACKQDEINMLMVALAKQGKRVIRLKGGDPLIFGRAQEEIAACRAAGLSVEVVPGITAAQAAASRLGISLTDRLGTRRVQYVTGHDRHGQLPDDVHWPSLADPHATTLVYMPGKTLPQLLARLVAAGLDPATPAAAVYGATRPTENIVVATVGSLQQALPASSPPGPVLVLIGLVLRQYTDGATRPARSTAVANAC